MNGMSIVGVHGQIPAAAAVLSTAMTKEVAERDAAC